MFNAILKTVESMSVLRAVFCSVFLWLTSRAVPTRTHKWKMISQGYPRVHSAVSSLSLSLFWNAEAHADIPMRGRRCQNVLCVFSLRSHSRWRILYNFLILFAYFLPFRFSTHFSFRCPLCHFVSQTFWMRIHLYHSPHFL